MPDLAASVDMVAIRGFDEYTFYNVNYQKGIGGPRVATSKYAGITLLTSAGESWYTGWQFSLTRPYRDDWQMQLRSEEHTSELQSRLHLVCRLLLEKKKNKTMQ